MRVNISITRLDPAAAGGTLIEELENIHPPKLRGHTAYSWQLYEDDPRLAVLLDRLHRAGFKPFWGTGRRQDHSREFVVRKGREYSAEDIEQTEYVRPVPDVGFEFHGRDAMGYVLIDFNAYKRAVDDLTRLDLVSDIIGSFYLVPERVKRLLEEMNGIGVQFRRTMFYDEAGSEGPFPWAAAGSEVSDEPWWELTSDLRMPPVSDRQEMLGLDRKPIVNRDDDGYSAAGVFFVEENYGQPELKYTRESLEQQMPSRFDLACTHEAIAPDPADDKRLLIASNRFYKFCAYNRLKFDWVPIRLEA